MVQRGSADACGCESNSERRYQTRSVTKSRANQASLTPQPVDPVSLGGEVPEGQAPTPEPEARDSFSTTPKGNGQLVSKLFDSITRFWGLIIRDQALPLNQSQVDERENRPLSPPTTITNDTTSGEECSFDSQNSLSKSQERNRADGSPVDAAVSNSKRVKARDCTPASDDNANLTRFNLDNLLLSEELKRLRVWKATFSNDELNRLPAIEHEVAQGVLKCLTSVANTLVTGYSDWQESSELGSLEFEKESLRLLVEQIETRISETNVDNEVMTDCGDFSETQESYLTAEKETLLKALKYEIDRLHVLSHSLRLGLTNGVIFATHG